MKQDSRSPEELAQMNSLLDEIQARHEMHLRNERAAIADIKLTVRDKERFDIEVFANLYSLRDLGTAEMISPEIVREYERGYYLRHPGFKTMRQYAEYLQGMDIYESSGSD